MSEQLRTKISKWSIGLCLGLLLVLINVVPTKAAYSSPFSYTVSKGSVTITGCDTSVKGILEVPETLEGYPVTSIGDSAFYGCSRLTSITIPEGVTSIGDSAFYGCSRLTSITIPEGVTNIRDDAFNECSSLTSVSIPEGVTSIGNRAFSGCSSLTSVSIPEGVTSIGNYTFCWCSSLTSVNIPEGVTSIGAYAFNGCDRLTSVNIVDITAWCKIQFDNALSNPLFDAYNLYINGEKVTNLIIPEGVTSIGNYAFCGCRSLTSVNIPERVTNVGNWAFYGCSNLTSISIPEGVTDIWDYAFSGCSSLTSVIIPEGVTSIWDYAFSGCSSLTNIIIPEGVTNIEEHAFSGCSSLTNMIIPEGVTNIGEHAFSGCSSLTSANIPSSVTSIGNNAFDRNIVLYVNNAYVKQYAIDNNYNYAVASGTMRIETLPNQVSYCKNEKLDVSGIKVIVDYFAGSSEEVTDKCTISGFNSSIVGVSTVIVKYKEFEATFNVHIHAHSYGDVNNCVCNICGYKRAITSIEVKTLPGQTSYCIGEAAYYRGLTVNVKYDDDSIEEITQDFTLSEFDSSAVGISTITVEYKGFKTTFDVEIHVHSYDGVDDFKCNLCGYERAITSIDIKTLPLQTSYCIGEEANYEGLVISVKYDDGSIEETDRNFEFSRLDTSAVGISTVRVNYEGFEITYDVDVHAHSYDGVNDYVCNQCGHERAITSIEIKKLPQISYCIGEEANYAGLTVRVKYDDGSMEETTQDLEFSGLDTSAVGKATVIVKYKGFKATFDVDVHVHSYDGANDFKCNQCGYIRSIISIDIKTLPLQTSYCIGEAAKYDGLVVNVRYDDGSVEEIVQDFELNGFDSSSVGVFTVTIKYKRFETAFDVRVDVHSYDGINDYVCNKCGYERKITSIDFKTLPLQTSYCIGETANYEGLMIGIKFDDGSMGETNQDYTVIGFDTSRVGTFTVGIIYKGFGITYGVDVHVHSYDGVNDFKCNLCGYERAITSIEVKTLPVQTSYCIGEAANYTGLIVRVKYDDNSVEEINRDFALSGFDSSAVGTSTITVNYKGFKTTFDVDVHVHNYDGADDYSCNYCGYERKITAIDFKTLPIQTSYCIGEAVNYEGLIVRVMFDDGSIEEITKDFELSEFDTNTVGTFTITVKYKGFEIAFDVEVHPHDFESWKVVKPVTMQAEGLEKRTCTICSHEETRAIEGIWKQDSTGWWYRLCNGTYPANCWKEISDVWYYFNASGYMVTGWQSIGGTWYYLSGSGAMQTGWQLIGGAWYYLDENGAMVTGWQLIDDTWYYLSGSGAMLTGWQAIGGTWYYLNGSGAMLTGWQAIGGTWYYFNENGAMLTGWQLIGDTWYYLNASGAMVANQWVGNYYLQADGSMATNKWIDNYYVDANGVWDPNK